MSSPSTADAQFATISAQRALVQPEFPLSGHKLGQIKSFILNTTTAVFVDIPAPSHLVEVLLRPCSGQPRKTAIQVHVVTKKTRKTS